MIKSRKLSPAAHLYSLRVRYPDGHGEVTACGRVLRWVQTLRPHALSAEYTIEVRLVQDGLPVILVLTPDLCALAGGRKLPHTYLPVDGLPSLCLWWQHDWNRSMAIAHTIIPWAAEWFWFFEHWLVTGEWLGGGSHPVPLSPPPASPESLALSA